MLEIRFRDIDPDTGDITQDKRIAICDSDKMANWIFSSLQLLERESDNPNRELYLIKIEENDPG